MIKIFNNKNIIYLVLVPVVVSFLFILSFGFAEAQNRPYTPISPITDLGISAGQNINLSTYLNALYRGGIIIATVLAVIMITIGAIEYMGSESVFTKGEGKKRMTMALLGLILALSSWIVLRTIDEQLIQSDIGDIPSTQSIQSESLSAGSYTFEQLDFYLSGTARQAEGIAGVAGGTLAQNARQAFNSASASDYGRSAGWTQEEIDAFNNANFDSDMAERLAAAAEYSADPNTQLYTCDVSGTNGGRLACAYAVNEMVNLATGSPINNSLATRDLDASLRNSSRFVRVPGGLSAVRPGDVIVSPTRGDVHGHTGIIDRNGNIISNSSNSRSSTPARVEQNYTTESWNDRFGPSGRNLGTNVYRAVQ
jgi:hypothetical protein